MPTETCFVRNEYRSTYCVIATISVASFAMRTATDIIETLGGSAAIARATGFPLTTIESWKMANCIPDWRRDRLLSLATSLGVALSTTDFPSRKPIAAPAEQVAA